MLKYKTFKSWSNVSIVYQLNEGKNKSGQQKRYTRTSRNNKKRKQTIQTYRYSEAILRWTWKQQHYSTEQRNYTKSQKKQPTFWGDTTLLQGQKVTRVESIGSLKTGNGESSQFKKPEITSIHSKKNLSTISYLIFLDHSYNCRIHGEECVNITIPPHLPPFQWTFDTS